MAGKVFPNLIWNVNPLVPSWLEGSEQRVGSAPALAALGYGLSLFGPYPDSRPREILARGLKLLRQRDPFPGDRMTFIHTFPALYGIALGVRLFREQSPELVAWLLDALGDQRLRPADRFQELFYEHTRAMLGATPMVITDAQRWTETSELALAYWMTEQRTAAFAMPSVDLPSMQRRLLRNALDVDEANLSVPRAALVHSALEQILEASIDQLVLSPAHVGLVLRRFEAAMRRWRWDDPTRVRDPIQWKITSEREVQDILWIILRSAFDEIVDEQTLPKVGHSSYRADFGLPRMGVLVEVKYARSKGDFKGIEKEVMEDSIGYLQGGAPYKEIVVFIYDASASVQEHDITARALLQLDSVSDVIIVSRPSVLAGDPPSSSPAT